MATVGVKGLTLLLVLVSTFVCEQDNSDKLVGELAHKLLSFKQDDCCFFVQSPKPTSQTSLTESQTSLTCANTQ